MLSINRFTTNLYFVPASNNFSAEKTDMNFLELAKHRYSVRAYRSTEVEPEKLNRILEAARLAPTACNLQSFKLVVIHTRGKEEELRRIYRAPWFVQAPLLICCCGFPDLGWIRRDGKNYTDVDTAIIMDHLILAATDEGLGTCWIGAFDPAEARRLLKLPEDVEPIAFTPLGYPDDQSPPKMRKPIQECVRYEHW